MRRHNVTNTALWTRHGRVVPAGRGTVGASLYLPAATLILYCGISPIVAEGKQRHALGNIAATFATCVASAHIERNARDYAKRLHRRHTPFAIATHRQAAHMRRRCGATSTCWRPSRRSSRRHVPSTTLDARCGAAEPGAQATSTASRTYYRQHYRRIPQKDRAALRSYRRRRTPRRI